MKLYVEGGGGGGGTCCAVVSGSSGNKHCESMLKPWPMAVGRGVNEGNNVRLNCDCVAAALQRAGG